MAAFMLATLISTIFALPANAASGDLGVAITSPTTAGNVKGGTNVVYTITVTNTDTIASLAATLTDNVGTGTYVGDNSGGSCTFVAPTLTCPVPAIPASGSWTVLVTVTAPAAPATLTNTANIAANLVPGDTDPSNNQAVNTQNVVATLADMTIAKNHTAGTLTPGSDVTYNLVVSNAGPDPATSVSVTDTLNASLTFKSSASSCTAVAQVVTCPVLDIPAAGTQTVSFVATIGAAVAANTVITNSASVTTATPESNGSNNTSNVDSLTVGAASVDLGVTLTVLPTTSAPGDTVTYTVTVSNPNTTTDATNVVVTDVLPTGLTAVSPPTAPSTGTAAVASNTWTWTIPTVAKASSATTPTVVTASFDAIVDPATTLTTITNTVTMMATQTDPVSTNNTASVDLTISALVADLHVLTAADDSKPNQGDTIQIAIQVSNAGPADATNVVLKDVLPTGLKYVSCKPCQQAGLRRQSSQLFSIPSIPANSASTVVLKVTVQASEGTLQNTASVVSLDQSDPTDANNSDSLNITIAGTTNNPGGGGTGGTSGGTSGGTGGTTAFTGFTAAQLMPWFMLLFFLGMVALEWARRMRLVSPIGSTYGFEPPF
jgi:uncharacterized repeat protein (TIGR01451 family)